MTIKVSEKASPEKVGDAIKKTKEQQIQLIYVGPQVKGVQRFSVFKGGYPKNLEEHLEKCTAFKQLFVPIQELNMVQMRLNDASTVESMFYNKIIEYFKGVK
ncbi:hypothetical protein LXM56_10515 [Lysinibacillus fusiformis]|uniref:hypothetical protein n=1 Tax=Lysinibacillus fusiformis TaxID=28031 RepID=UPI001E3A10BF|nr:hypothetical protein [Lysinibacillus fusiformis]MCE4044559.1 hypothetical protein [Lysinibacillus fusiformis]